MYTSNTQRMPNYCDVAVLPIHHAVLKDLTGWYNIIVINYYYLVGGCMVV